MVASLSPVSWPHPLRAVLYDLDGVLLDSMSAWYRVIQRGARELGHPPVTFEHFRGTFGQGAEADRDQFFPEWTAAEVFEFYERVFPEEMQAVELLPDSLEVLQAARRLGLRQAVVTNTPLTLARQILEAKDLALLLDGLAAAGEGREKPAPDLILLALSRLGVGRTEVLYLGDSPTDVTAARAAGVTIAGIGVEADLTFRQLREILPLLHRNAVSG